MEQYRANISRASEDELSDLDDSWKKGAGKKIYKRSIRVQTENLGEDYYRKEREIAMHLARSAPGWNLDEFEHKYPPCEMPYHERVKQRTTSALPKATKRVHNRMLIGKSPGEKDKSQEIAIQT